MSSEPAELMGDEPIDHNHRAQAYPKQTAYARRGSLKPPEPDTSKRSPVRPSLQSRTKSAPLVEQYRQVNRDVSLIGRYLAHEEDDDDDYTLGSSQWRKDDETAPPVPPTRFDSVPLSRLESRIPEINVAVIGADGVGKTTFLQKALDLLNPPLTCYVEQKVAYRSNQYLVRLLEIPIDYVDVDDDDDTICWPDTIGNSMTPKIDGALTLYDVKDKSSLARVPQVLTALSKASVPSILISCKCDVAPFERDLDPVAIEEKAKRSVRNLVTLQTSSATSDNHKRGISMIIRAITSCAGGDNTTSKRKRAQSSALGKVPSAPPELKGHVRAASEHSSIVLRDKLQKDASIAKSTSVDHLRALQEDGMQRSFFLEESGTDSSAELSEASNNADHIAELSKSGTLDQSIAETGVTFEELVDRLLAQPKSKADNRFSASLLALYRNFAAPGELFEAIIERFDVADRLAASDPAKTTAQVRCLRILERWIADYPGDFAFTKTKRRMQAFIVKADPIAALSGIAKDIGRHLLVVRENDDTKWAYNDENREVDDLAMSQYALPKHGPIDDLDFALSDDLSGLTITDHLGLSATLVTDPERPASNSSTTSSQIMLNVNVAQRAARQIEARGRIPLTKEHWRTLIEIPDEVVAKELTRMDWVMFSSIRPRDLVRHISLSSLEKEACQNLANVDRMINHFNQVAAWVANFILLREKPKHRALMLEKFMRIARKLRELNNYNSLGALIAGIKSSAIHRLAATRELLPPSIGKDWMKLEILMAPSRSHSAYRLAWENSSSQRIPYIPLHRRDLVSAEEGNKTFIGEPANGRINWKKFEVMGDIIVSLQRAQSLPYHGIANCKGGEQVRELVLDLQLVKDEEDLYDRSTQCEPPAGSNATATTRFMDLFKR